MKGFFTKEQLAGMARVARYQVMAATACLDPMGCLGSAIEEIPVDFVHRESVDYVGLHWDSGTGSLGRITMNVAFCPTEEQVMKTLYHEFAHAVAHWLYGVKIQDHGAEWKSVMTRLGQPIEARYT